MSLEEKTDDLIAAQGLARLLSKITHGLAGVVSRKTTMQNTQSHKLEPGLKYAISSPGPPSRLPFSEC